MHFYKYLISQNITVQCPEDFVARKFMKKYIEDTIHNIISCGAKIEFVLDEVLDFQEKELYVILRTSKDLYFFDYVVLSPGLGISNLDIGIKCITPNFDEVNLQRIKNDNNVIIYGTALSAVDAAVLLRSYNHSGKITMYSRSGGLPSVKQYLSNNSSNSLNYNSLNSKYNLISLIKTYKDLLLKNESCIASKKLCNQPTKLRLATEIDISNTKSHC
jgi:uncharacterized NAD(P)/FAD-binding protein YdhS